jgi:hypothetical protein
MHSHARTTLFFSLVIVGCASESPQPPAPAPTVVIPAQLPATLTAAQYFAYRTNVECAAMFACAQPLAHAALRPYVGDYARCVARVDLLPDEVTRRHTATLLAAGRVRFDADAARRCLEGLRASVCAEPAACEAVFVGTTALGAPCFDREECAGDAYCAYRTLEGAYNCPGRCAARVALGESCFGDNEACASTGAGTHVRCMFDPARSGQRFPFACVDRGPLTVVPEGGECADRGDGSAPFRTCAPGLDCGYVSNASGVVSACIPPAAAGDLCTRYCQPGALCEFDNTRFTQRCLPFVVRDTEGGRCVQGNSGAEACNVLLGLDCVAGRCQRVGTGAENSVCFTNRFGLSNCNAGLFCNPATMTCQRRLADGMPCRSDDECEVRNCETTATGSHCAVEMTRCG